MHKADLAKVIADKAGIGKRAAKEFVNLMFDVMIAALMREERIAIRDFGNFTIRRIRTGISHNPRTGEKITVPERRFPFFKAGRDLVERVNNQPVHRKS